MSDIPHPRTPDSYPESIEPGSIDPDFPPTPGAPVDPGTASDPNAPQPDAPSIDPPGPITPVEPVPEPTEPDPTPDEPTFPAEDRGSFDGEDPNPPTEQFVPGSFN